MLGHVVHKGESVLGEDGMPLLRAEPLIKLRSEWTQLQAALDKTRAKAHTPARTRRRCFSRWHSAACATLRCTAGPSTTTPSWPMARDDCGQFNYYRCKGH